MAKKKATKPRSGSTRQSSASAESELDAAEERLRLAREELKQARETFAAARKRAVESADEFEEGTFGELLDSGLNFVKKYPALGIFAATAFGVFLGRLFRR